MRILSLRRLAIAGALGISGLSLVGLGVGAVFTAQTTSTQQITAGSVSVAISSPSSATCPSASSDCASLALPTVGPVTSSFSTGDQTIIVTNTGTLGLSQLNLSFSLTNASSDLAAAAYVCLGTTGTGSSFTQIYDGPLAGLVGGSYIQNGSPLLPPGSTYTFVVNIYAGSVSTACGSVSSPPLDSAAQVESVTLTSNFTVQD